MSDGEHFSLCVPCSLCSSSNFVILTKPLLSLKPLCISYFFLPLSLISFSSTQLKWPSPCQELIQKWRRQSKSWMKAIKITILSSKRASHCQCPQLIKPRFVASLEGTTSLFTSSLEAVNVCFRFSASNCTSNVRRRNLHIYIYSRLNWLVFYQDALQFYSRIH